MKEEKNPRIIGIRFFIALISITLIISLIISLLKKSVIDAIVISIGFIIFLLPFLLLRKFFFSYIIINKKGVAFIYRSTTIRNIDCIEIKESNVIINSLIASKTEIYYDKDFWRNEKENIVFRLTKKIVKQIMNLRPEIILTEFDNLEYDLKKYVKSLQ